MLKVNINNTRSRPHWLILTQSKRLVPYQDFKIFIIANRQGIVQKSHNLLFHRDFWLLLDIFQSLYFSKSDMFHVCRRRKSRLVDIFVNKSHSLFCYVSLSINYFLVLYTKCRFFLLSCLQEAISHWQMLPPPPSLKLSTWRYSFLSNCKMLNGDIFPSRIAHVTPCVHQLIHRHEQMQNILA